MIVIFTDGGSRGNPGPAAYGVSITKNGKEIAGFGKTIGIETNNTAEYSGAYAALSWLVEHSDVLDDKEPIELRADSQLLVSQLNGLYKIKSPHLRELLFKIRTVEQSLPSPVIYKHIPREQNKVADSFVNRALDNAS